jgi:ribosomal protein S12 methylthiotransferase accessory factor
VDSLRFRSSLQVDVVDGGRVFLLNDEDQLIIDDPVTAQVAALIDGSRAPAQIIAALGRDLAPARVFSELAKLRRAGHVLAGPSSGSTQTFIESWGRATDGYADRAASFCVSVLDLSGSRTAPAVVEAVTRLGALAQAVDEQQDLARLPVGGLLVVVVADYLDPRLRTINAELDAAGQTWLLTKPWGREVWVGPRIVPGETGCWECLADRLTANRQVERYVQGKRGTTLPRVKPGGLMPGAEGIAAGLVASEVFAMSAGLVGSLQGILRTLDLKTMVAAEHVLVAQPQCPVSGTPGAGLATSDVRLLARDSSHRADGGYRVCSPGETYARLKHHISPHLGAVSKLESLDTDTEGVTYSFVAGHNFGMVQDNIDLLRGNLRGQSGGKGRTEIQARVSAVCEAVERFSGVWSPQVPAVRTAFADLDRRALHPADSLLFSGAQFAGRHAWNADPRNRLHRVPEPFDESRPIDFTPAWSLTRDEEVLVPAGLVWFGQPDLADHFYTVTDSNGGAAGNTVEEAVLQGLCEVYERDAVALWWYSRAARPCVDLASFADPYVQVMLDHYETLDRDLWVLDLSNDLSMSVFAAFSRRRHEVEDVMVGFGAHPDPQVALFRSLTELNQFLPFVARRDDKGTTVYRTNDAATLQWCRTVTVANEPWIAPHPSLAPVTRTALARTVPTDLRELVRWCVADLQRAGLETIVVNQTRPDIDLAVVKVFVPGMRHFWPRSGAGRLYDVPVRLGWLDAPQTEAELNPRGVFF